MKFGFLLFYAVLAKSQPFDGSANVEKCNDNLTATLSFSNKNRNSALPSQ